MRTHIFAGSLVAGIISTMLLTPVAFAQTQASTKTNAQGGAELLWLGQAGFRIKSPAAR